MTATARKIDRLVAYVLSLPVLILLICVAPLVMLLAIPPLAMMVFRKKRFNLDRAESNGDATRHAIITGGSSGIGLAIAKECLECSFDRVTILARNQEKLDDAIALLEQEKSSRKVDAFSVDVSDPVAVAEAAGIVCRENESNGGKCRSTFLFTCAGVSTPGYFEKLPPEVFAKQAHLNYLGAVNTVHAFLPYMKRGTIALTLSAAGQVGVHGFTAYSGTKFALRGFAESLHMELLCRNVHVQLSFPPDTDTPGYQIEQQSKPKACDLISQTAGLFKPQDVAKVMVREAIKSNPKYTVYFGMEGWMLSTLTAGMSPESSFANAVCQVGLMGLLRLVSFFFLNDFWDICRDCHVEEPRTSTP